MSLNESIVDDAALEWFRELGYAVGHGLKLAPGEPAAERNRSESEMGEVNSFSEVVLVGRLCEAIRRLNPATICRTVATPRDTLLPKLEMEATRHAKLAIGTEATLTVVLIETHEETKL